MSELFTPEEVAQIFKVEKATVLEWHRKGLIKGIKVQKTIRFSSEAIEALKQANYPAAANH